jgi:hypothetical protein
MSKQTEYTSGWIDTTIHDFLSAMGSSSEARYALITSLDSSFAVASIADANPQLQELRRRGLLHSVGGAISLPTSDLLKIEGQQRLFFGFDEVWFSSRSPGCPKPKEIVITGPGRIRDTILPSLAQWMQSNHCSLGVGDGEGLNFCAKLTGITKRLVDAFGEAALSQSRARAIS